ncbi:MAG TPA: polysaccharide deacetylase family protein [Spirochaetota bacterium]|nr:polysaccharide deacetylase family protein [Spirochaetota bacterium]HPJ35049.1 polysaccharide deacetylase family protein [Spirochaetota bacterium]
MKKINLLALILFVIITVSEIPSYSAGNGTYILCYHAFLERKDPYSFSKDQLREQLQRLKNKGFTFITFEDLINNRVQGTNNILITIDDGNKSVYDAYYSVMKPMGIKPVLGIYPAIIGRMHYALSWEELKKLANDGCYIASHGYHHMYLSTKYYKKEPKNFLKEIYYSKKVLERKLGRRIELMVYPFGVFSDIAISELKKAGYKYGMSLKHGICFSPVPDGFEIPRYMLTKPNQKGLISLFIRKAGDSSSSTVAAIKADEPPALDLDKKKYRVTLKNYPQEIHKMVMNDIIFMPEKKTPTNRKKNRNKKKLPKFKPYIHKGTFSGKNHKNPKKQSSLPVKEEKDKTVRKQSAFMTDIKETFLLVQNRFSSFIYSVREMTELKISVLKTRVYELFS